MKKFLALYTMPMASLDSMMQNTSPEDMKKGMDAWTAWGEAHKADLVDLGAPVGKNKRVTKDGITDTRNEVVGYSVVQANSHEEAAAIFNDSPHIQMEGAYVELMPLVEM